MDAKTIVAEISGYISKSGATNWNQVYVGITGDPSTRLFSAHQVNKDTDAWIFRKADSAALARDIESYFLEKLGADGGPGGGDNTAVYVYAYKKARHTNP